MAYYNLQSPNNWVELKVNSQFFFIAKFHPLTQKDLLGGVTKKNYMNKKQSIIKKCRVLTKKMVLYDVFSKKTSKTVHV